MEYRTLGNTGLSVSAIALGCEGFVGKTEEQTCAEMDFAISKGINFMPPTPIYAATSAKR